MSEITLSFCIPTYNRSEIVFKNISNILCCPDPDIEVVVLDNGSTDNTLNLLETITDNRLSIYTNGSNRGFLYNVLHVLDKGKGNYLIFSTDKDTFSAEKISQFKDFLLGQSGLAGGFCEFNSKSPKTFDLFPAGFSAVREIAHQARHPTGFFFKNKLLKKVKIIENYSDSKYVDLFPLDFVFGKLCLLGQGAIYYPDFIQLETGAMAAKVKSFETNGIEKEAFFSPASRLRMAINFYHHINTLDLLSKDKTRLSVDVFMRGLSGATTGYKAVMKNTDLCTHYGMPSMHVSNQEMINHGLTYCVGFFKITWNSRGGKYLPKASFLFHAMNFVFLKICKKLGIYKK